MAWPPTPFSTAGSKAYLSGSPTIRWGTDGINPQGLATAIVVSCSPSDEVETLYVENGTGLKVVRVMLWQGRKVNITIVDDSTITAPFPGASISLFDPMHGNNAALVFTVLDNSYNAARKEPGQRVIVAEYLTMIEGGGTPPSNA